jgi:hypothetical protein
MSFQMFNLEGLRLRGTIVVLAAALLSSCAPVVYTHGVPNLHQVRAGWYRSGQVEAPEGWAYLRSIGVTDVVKLDFAREGSDDGAVAAGLRVHSLPINPTTSIVAAVASLGLTELLRPDSAMMASIRHLIREVRDDDARFGHPARVMLIHCSHGWDRTGLVSGMVLVLNGDMGKDEVWQYMLDTGFHWEHVGLWREWRAFAERERW